MTTTSMFGDLKVGLGIVNNTGSAYWWPLQQMRKTTNHVDGIWLGDNIKEAGVQCTQKDDPILLILIILTPFYRTFSRSQVDGKVLEYDMDELNQNQQPQSKILTMPHVFSMATSATHVLFAVKGGAPVYGMGSNRMGQLGLDMSLIQHADQPTVLDFFDGLGTMDNSETSAIKVACGPFHSAVTIHHDLYTFGWNDQGRIGWGLPADEGDNDSTCSIYDNGIKLASFIDNGRELDVLVDKVCCGSAHTVALDVDGFAWTCGSDKYLQLGRKLENHKDTTYDNYFRRCSGIKKTVVDCQVGSWSTLLLERQ
ncbi:regulator of chromosome condensation 1/beta-lactamase-inhibitor protein II [Absidia repens]|uniref:Regulator of chromosome condensation 1/beta-lactamase-inhibitor protein II n=1 Tax=Absidia repens TaxID=90262 RepID=A0A1X2J1G9_9FUNG|nr:regulator of chromosome condensation 1/beta-lactamase-inhibitor protein II [Absidia repens]